jgi:hypothetical protein
MKTNLAVLLIIVGLSGLVNSSQAFAHCDTMDGPVVADARLALEKADITLALKWVKPEGEKEVVEAFQKAIAVRDRAKDVKEIADLYFFETLVRVHRAGEGAPYNGLKPAGYSIEPSIIISDKALETGSIDSLIADLNRLIALAVRERFAHAVDTRTHASYTVEEGRAFVSAYVEFTHYIERLYADANSDAAHHGAIRQDDVRHEH